MNPYRQRVWEAMAPWIVENGPYQRVLDFGSGDGWFAEKLSSLGIAGEVVALDVKRRSHAVVEPIIYDGKALPFCDGEFDLVYEVDALHHSPTPEFHLKELARVAKKALLIKDHTSRNWLDRALLAVLDELGNRKFGIPSTHDYQRDWAWSELLSASGWKEVRRLHPLICHRGVLGRVTNHLQYLALFSISEAPRAVQKKIEGECSRSNDCAGHQVVDA